MFLRHCELHTFRSWDNLVLDLEPGTVLLTGANGQGKTNFIEGINYLATLKSHRVSGDVPLIKEGANSAQVVATAVHNQRELTIAVDIQQGRSNQASLNTSPCKPREIMGVLSTVLFAPEDLELVRGEPAQRRAFLDTLLVQRRPRLAAVLSQYDKVLRQRNALLKSASLTLRHGYSTSAGTSALATLDAWDAQLAHFGAQIVVARQQLLQQLGPLFSENYQQLAPQSRPATVGYQSLAELTVPSFPAAADSAGLEASVDSVDSVLTLSGEVGVDYAEAALLTGLAAQRTKEIDRGITLAGPHRDDMSLMLGVQPAKGFASHGESWSVALALRLASYHLLQADGVEPVLLLDDVFAELDRFRREALAEVARDAEQAIITAAVGEDLPSGLTGPQHFHISTTGAATHRSSVIVDSADASATAEVPVSLTNVVDAEALANPTDAAGGEDQ